MIPGVGGGAAPRGAALLEPAPAVADGGMPNDPRLPSVRPVDVTNGQVYIGRWELELPGTLGLRWGRLWLSRSSYAGPLGRGWHHSYDIALQETRKALVYNLSDGRDLRLPPIPVGKAHFERSERATIWHDPEGYVIYTPGQLVLHFRPSPTRPQTHLLHAIQHASGRSLRLQHDTDGRLIAIHDGAGRTFGLTRDAAGRIASLDAPHPEHQSERMIALRYDYDELGNLIRATDALGQQTHYTYAEHQLIKVTDRNGASFLFEYDGPGPEARCVRSRTDGGLHDHKLTYDAASGTTVVEDSLGARTQYRHRGGLVGRIVDPLGATRVIEYDDWKSRRAEVDALGQRTNYSYDQRGNLQRVLRPDGAETTASYDAHDRPMSVTLPNGAGWSFVNDPQGRIAERVDPLGGRTRLKYSGPELSEICDPAEQRHQLAYDAQGNLCALRTHDGALWSWTYDRLGRLTSCSDPAGQTRQLVRDRLGRVVRVFEPDGLVRELAYDGEDRLVLLRDPQRSLALSYSSTGCMLSQREGSATIRFERDTEERLRAIHDPVGRTHRFERDPRGHVVAEYAFDGVARRFERDAAGRVVTSMTAADSGETLTTRYGYDAANRLTSVEHPDGEVERYTYHALGLLASAENGRCQLQREYDALGRLIRETRDQHWVEQRYDTHGRCILLRSSLGAELHSERDQLGHVAAHKTPGWEALYQRDVLGRELARVLPGGAHSRWQRDVHGRPLHHEIASSYGPLRACSYVWEVGERLLQLADSHHGLVHFAYDERARLAWARYSEGEHDLRLPDEVGNLFRTEQHGDRAYGTAGELLEAIDQQGQRSQYRYDDAGQLVSKLDLTTQRDQREQAWHYRWNAAGRLAAITRPDGDVIRFDYDPLGRRIRKHFRGQTTHYLWNEELLLHEWVEGELEARMVTLVIAPAQSDIQPSKRRELELEPHLTRGPQERGSASAPITWLHDPDTQQPIAKQIGARVYSVITDHLGAPRVLLDAQGGLHWSISLDSYGELRHLKGQRQACPFRWPGQYEDAESGLYYHRHRYFDPGTGRYLSRNPAGITSGLALYAHTLPLDGRPLQPSAADTPLVGILGS
ncbi:MAG: DUF6531 domain-containing protein [Polyangiales bacterium]